MPTDSASWVNTTHDWATPVDHDHVAAIRCEAVRYAAGGLVHLALEVLAYAADEAAALGRRGTCRIRLHDDGSVSVADDGRGTDTRRDEHGRVVRKPVMATRDLRFFDTEPAVLLPDGRPRRGMSVVAALSDWLVHTNRRTEGAWQQRYEHGIPVGDLVPAPATEATGTTVRFRPDRRLVPGPLPAGADLLAAARFDRLDVELQV